MAENVQLFAARGAEFFTSDLPLPGTRACNATLITVAVCCMVVWTLINCNLGIVVDWWHSKTKQQQHAPTADEGGRGDTSSGGSVGGGAGGAAVAGGASM